MIKHNGVLRYRVDPNFFPLSARPEAKLLQRVILKGVEDAIMPLDRGTFYCYCQKTGVSAFTERSRVNLMACREDAYEWLHSHVFQEWLDLLFPDDEEAEVIKERVIDFVEEWRERVRNGEKPPKLLFARTNKSN